ncbi:MAG: glycosyltransferase family 4 protein, partial [Proteobacteria bacterium]|nr:glycosyltransferase family 4 protein [Pseudomonadota bacterium]
MSTDKLRVLCLDVEGGYGGSSRSLFESLAHMDRRTIEPTVWCKRDGPIQAKYEALGISVSVKPGMPKVSSLPRLSRNIFVYAKFLKDWITAATFRRDLAKAANDVDVVHFNHEALFLLARWLKPRTGAALSMHIRTNLYGTPFCRWQDRMIAKTLDQLVFITENERRSLKWISGLDPDGTVIYN